MLPRANILADHNEPSVTPQTACATRAPNDLEKSFASRRPIRMSATCAHLDSASSSRQAVRTSTIHPCVTSRPRPHGRPESRRTSRIPIHHFQNPLIPRRDDSRIPCRRDLAIHRRHESKNCATTRVIASTIKRPDLDGRLLPKRICPS
jgi:hypothetical protein